MKTTAVVKKALLSGRGSEVYSDFSVFEHMNGLEFLLQNKNIKEGGYFCVGQIDYDYRKIYVPDVAKYNLIVAGFKPAGESKKVETPEDIISRRRYSRLVVNLSDRCLERFSEKQKEAIKAISEEQMLGEIRLQAAQVYKMNDEDYNFSLVMKEYEWLEEEKNKRVFDAIVKEKNLLVVDAAPRIFMYEPKGSRGHFLAGYKYVVRAISIIDNNSLYPEKLLCTDLLCGVTGAVHNRTEQFKEID